MTAYELYQVKMQKVVIRGRIKVPEGEDPEEFFDKVRVGEVEAELEDYSEEVVDDYDIHHSLNEIK